MNRFEKRRHAIDRAIREHIDQYKAIYKKAETDDREPSDDERLDIESQLKAIETLKTEREEVEANLKTLQHVDDIGRELGPAISVTSEPHDRFIAAANAQVFPQAQKSIGEQFIQSKAYTEAIVAYKERGGRFPENFSTGPVGLEMKGTLGEAAGSGGGAYAVPVPQVVPGVVEKLFQPLTIADLLLSGQVSGNLLRYVVEGTATSGAAGVAEAGAKPESTLGFTTTDEPVKKIATLLPVADEMLEDAPAIQSYINGRLVLFVRIEEERQLFRGTSGGNEVQGLLTSRSVPVFAGTVTDSKADQLFKAMNGVRGSAFVEPDYFVIHPTDWQAIRLLKDGTGGTAGQYYGGGPFLGAYGNAGYANPNSNQTNSLPADSIWNKPTYVTAGIGGAGTALIVTRSAAQVWRRGGVSVEATNSHSTYFANNLVAIRAEERLALACYRPGAFCEVRLA